MIAYNDFSKDELWEALVEYINYISEYKGVSFLSHAHEKGYTPRSYAILQVAEMEADG